MNFFITGFPKSGTTWLQQIVNTHPDAVCRPEDNFFKLFEALGEAMHKYNEIRATINHRTGKAKDVSYYSSEDLIFMLIQAVRAAFAKSDVDISGTKDNSILPHLDIFQVAFHNFKIVHLVRDPRDCAVSSWHHNIRVEGKQEFLQRSGVQNIDEWSFLTAELWQKDTNADLFTVKYEDLLENFDREVARVFEFLGLKVSDFILEDVKNMTKFEQNKGENKFYRKGKAGAYIDELQPETVFEMCRIARKGMAKYGYV